MMETCREMKWNEYMRRMKRMKRKDMKGHEKDEGMKRMK